MSETEQQHGGGLPQGAWKSEVHAALLNLIDTHGADSPGFNPERPPLVVIDCDDTLLHHSLGEALMRFVITRRRIKTDRGFWQVVPERLGRDAINAAHKAVAGRSDPEVADTAAYRRYRAGMLNVYESLRENEGAEAAAVFAARMLKGLHERTVADLVEEVLDHELDRPLSHEDVPPGPPFSGLVVPTGIRVHHELLELINALETKGFQTWIVGSSAVQVMRALARRINFPEERVLGIELTTQGGTYTDKVTEPVPVGEGKVELFLDTVGRSPVLAIGDSMEDFEMFENCEGLCIVLDRGDEELLGRAKEHGWLVQPALSI